MSAELIHRILVVDDNTAIHADFRKIIASEREAESALDPLEDELFETAAPAKLPDFPAKSVRRVQFEIDSAYQGEEALKLVRKAAQEGRPYTLAFVDVRMPPGWDGIETTARIWKEFPDLHIVICTAYSDYGWDDLLKILGTSDRLLVLKKPFDRVEVLQLAHALAERWTLSQQSTCRMNDLEAKVAEYTKGLQSALESLETETVVHVK